MTVFVTLTLQSQAETITVIGSAGANGVMEETPRHRAPMARRAAQQLRSRGHFYEAIRTTP